MVDAKVCALVAGVFGALGGCGSAVSQVPSKGGAAWRELTSEHFTIWTDGEPEEVRGLVSELERVRQVILGAAFPSAPSNSRVFVIALRDDGELIEFSSTSQARAYARAAYPPLWQPMIVMSAFSNWDNPKEQIAHELTHVISSSVIHYQPRWLAEGLAQYFGTLHIDRGGTAADVGLIPQIQEDPRRLANRASMSELFAWKGITEHEDWQYNAAWAVVAFLMNNHRDELLQYFELLEAEGRSRRDTDAQEAEQLWNRAFPTLPAAAVHDQLFQWLTNGKYTASRFRIEPRSWPIAERPLSDADVYAARGMLRLFQDREEQARNEAAAALAAEPTNVLGRLVQAGLGGTAVSGDQARAMTAAHHGDWRAWWIAAQVYANGAGDARELATARITACTLIMHNPALVAPPDLVPAAHGRAQDVCLELLNDAAAKYVPVSKPASDAPGGAQTRPPVERER